MSKLQHVTVKGLTNFWGATEYEIIDIETGGVVRSDLGNNQIKAFEIAKRIDAQIAAEKQYGADTLAIA